MNSRQRVKAAINHKQTDRIPFDMGGMGFSGIAASTLYDLRKHLGLEEKKIKVAEPFSMLGVVEDDFRELFDVDVISLPGEMTKFGYKNTGWKTWNLPQNGLEVLVGEGFVTTQDADGNIYAHPQGDVDAKPSGKMPKGGYYFDALVRQEEFDEYTANGKEDYKETYKVYDEEYLRLLEQTATRYYNETEYSIFGSLKGGGLGNFANIPATELKYTPGIRDPEEWLVALMINKDYITQVFEYQTETAIKNLELYKQATGDKIDVILVGDTDFGTQNGEFIAPTLFRELYKPYFKRMNDWVHENTEWKTFYHCCGSIVNLLDDFVEMGVDIINPVQCSAKGMDAEFLKKSYGDKLTFWGGGIDTQKTLPFGTPEDVKREALERLQIFSKDGGYIFSTIHNIQANTPVENITALFEAYKEFNGI